MNLRFAPTLNSKLHLGNIRVLFFNKLISEITNLNLMLRIDFKDKLSDDISNSNEKYIKSICSEYLNIKFSKVIYQKYKKEIYIKYLNSISEEYKFILNDIVYLNFKLIQEKFAYIKYNDFVFGSMKKKSILIKNIPVYNIVDDLFFYNFTSVIDDIEEDISIIVRGSDHIDNTFLQIMIFICLNYENKIPSFCHIPLCLNSKGSKISKSSSEDNIYLEYLLYERFILVETIYKYLTGYDFEDKNLKLCSLKISNKNKYIDINDLNKMNIQVIKNMEINKLKFYLLKFKSIDIDLDILQKIQPFIICIDKFINALKAILDIRDKKLNFESLVIQNKKLLNKEFKDYENLNIIFKTNLGNEIISIINYKFYNEIFKYILKYC